ncbi:MAG: hypothetical protein RL088_1460 [Verrucomicrobiota bacterium]|jgi:hypothetical protein
MNTNAPENSGPGKRKPVVVSGGLNRRDILLAVAILVGILGFVAAAVYSTGTAKNPNMLSGEIREKYRTGEQIRDLVVSGKGVSDKVVNSGCYLKVYVASVDKIYNVMLAESEWETKRVGDKIEFLRPASERQ